MTEMSTLMVDNTAGDPPTPSLTTYYWDDGTWNPSSFIFYPTTIYTTSDEKALLQLRIRIAVLLDSIAERFDVQDRAGFTCSHLRALAELIDWSPGKVRYE